MKLTDVLTDAALAAAASYAATEAMEQFNLRTYALESEVDREREEAARRGPPFRLAAENLSERVLGVELDDDQTTTVGTVFHYLAGLSWTPVYLLLRRRLGWNPTMSGLATGASMSLILDETITPAIGASAPNDAYPTSTHVRAFAAHLVYGLTVSAVVETGWRLLGRHPDRCHPTH